jgi:hypothetical protein
VVSHEARHCLIDRNGKDILPGSGYICQFFSSGPQPRRMERRTAIQVVTIRPNPKYIRFLNPRPSYELVVSNCSGSCRTWQRVP